MRDKRRCKQRKKWTNKKNKKRKIENENMMRFRRDLMNMKERQGKSDENDIIKTGSIEHLILVHTGK